MKKQSFRTITILADIFILCISFLIMIWTKPSSLKSYLPSHSFFFISLAIIWLLVSLLNGKMHRGKIVSFSSLFVRVFSSNIISLSITALIMFILRDYAYSRAIVLGTVLIATFLELFVGSIYIAYKKASVQDLDDYESYKLYHKPTEHELVSMINGNHVRDTEPHEISPGIFHAIKNECGEEMAQAVVKIAGNKLKEKTAVLSTTSVFNISSLPEKEYSYIINLHRFNDIKNLDDFLDAVNNKLKFNGHFFGCLETKDQRKARILKKFPPVLNYIYYIFDFVVKRIFPKLKITRPLYFFLTHGNNAVISRAEALGRMTRSGFNIEQEFITGNLLCIEGMKCRPPLAKNTNLYGPLIALPRVGKNGETIKVYKLRTMHPYSEYIQDYVYRHYDLKPGGKYKNDFRITSWGSVLRKVWIDELPMLINLFKGNMKIVGVRPLSKQYFKLYKKEVRLRRIKYKPGLIPPFYADLPSDLESIQASEMKYLDEYDKHPFLTDFKYFWKSVWNIVFKKVRSD